MKEKQFERKLTWKKDKWHPKDYLHQAVGAIPTSFDLSAYCPSVRDQGYVGSCTGFGIGGMLTGLAKQLSCYTQWFSPTWIYNGARFIEGTLSNDDGAYPADCMTWIKKMGCLLEGFWPYNPNALDPASPPSKYNAEAAKWPVLTYVRVTGGSAGICSAIAAGNLVTIGTPWFDSWMSPPASGILPNVTVKSSVAGGHMTFLYGYDQTTKLFSGQNSWAADWGIDGRYKMPFSPFDGVFSSLGGYDAYYVTAGWGTPAPPTPPAPPAPTGTQYLWLRHSPDNKNWNDVFKGELK